MSEIAQAHRPCPACGSSDALAVYTDGHSYCFSCQKYCPGEGAAQEDPLPMETSDLEFRDLPKRRLRAESLAKFGYGLGSLDGQAAHVLSARGATGKQVAQKYRLPDKKFLWRGSPGDVAQLWGQHLWRSGGKWVVITEGELDALSVAQAFNLKWPVVSLLNGASSAVREVKRSIEWLESFEKVILFFDGDDAGKKAVQAVAPLFSPGKVFVAVPPEGFKDANDMLQAGQFAQLCHVVFQASPYRPDGIVSGASLWPMFDDFYYGRSIPNTYRVPFPKLQEYTRGMRGGELWTVGGGTGVGKSSFVAEIAHDMLLNQGAKLGYIALEESQCFTGLRQLSLAMNVPLHLCHRDPQGVLQVSHDSYKEAWDRTLGSGRLFLYDHWGSLQSENLLSKIRYLIRGCDCSMIVLDHVSIVVSGISGGDERRMIDNLMTNLRSMSQETGCGFLIVSHLRRPDGNAHEEGGRVHLSDFRGSGAIAQLSDTIVGLERNQQDESLKFFSQLRVLKNRFSGTTGIVDTIEYTPTSGRLQASAANPDFGFD